MTIEFETPKPIAQIQFVLKTVAENMMRSQSRAFDENEHEIPWSYIEFMHTAMQVHGRRKSCSQGREAAKRRR